MTGFTYKSYNFTDKDPIIDEVRTIFDDAGVNYAWVEDHSGVSATTLNAWFKGATRRPQAATINAVLRALGYRLGVVAMAASDARPAPLPSSPRMLPPPTLTNAPSEGHKQRMSRIIGRERR